MPVPSQPPACPAPRPARSAFRWPASAILRTLLGWAGRCAERNRQRRALARLDDRLLRDIGLSRADAETELREPPWRPLNSAC